MFLWSIKQEQTSLCIILFPLQIVLIAFQNNIFHDINIIRRLFVPLQTNFFFFSYKFLFIFYTHYSYLLVFWVFAHLTYIRSFYSIFRCTMLPLILQVHLTSEEEHDWQKLKYLPLPKVLEHFEKELMKDLRLVWMKVSLLMYKAWNCSIPLTDHEWMNEHWYWLY